LLRCFKRNRNDTPVALERNESPLRPLALHIARIILNLARLLTEEPNSENHIRVLVTILELGIAVRRLEREARVVLDID
jgi:hypothetical protein